MTPEKEAILNSLNHLLATATLIGFVVLSIWFIDLLGLHLKMWKGGRSLYKSIATYALPIGFFAMLGSTLISLYYSDYLGILPCGLCWFQRVFIYSQVFILGYAWLKKDYNIFTYATVLSLAGLPVALYQEYLQLGYSELLPCPAIASTVDCAKPTFVEYHFVTFPFMSVVLLGGVLLLSYVAIRYKRGQ
jgi:disulfide bond formation protein DsbB